MTRTARAAVVGLGLILLLAACSRGDTPVRPNAEDRRELANQQQALDNHLKSNSVRHLDHAGNHDPLAIPSVDRAKTRTTNETGRSSYGPGSYVYSLIGSSGLHSHGVSSHLESRLSGQGMSDIRVFAVDDMVILATEQRVPTASKYDALQQQVLSGAAGISGNGVDPGPSGGVGTFGTGDSGADNLSQAKRWVLDNMGKVDVYTVSSREAVRTIDRIRARAGSGTPQQMGSDIRRLLQIAMSSKS